MYPARCSVSLKSVRRGPAPANAGTSSDRRDRRGRRQRDCGPRPRSRTTVDNRENLEGRTRCPGYGPKVAPASRSHGCNDIARRSPDHPGGTTSPPGFGRPPPVVCVPPRQPCGPPTAGSCLSRGALPLLSRAGRRDVIARVDASLPNRLEVGDDTRAPRPLIGISGHPGPRKELRHLTQAGSARPCVDIRK